MLGAMVQILIGVLVLITPFVGTPITSAALGALLFVGAGTIQALIASWIGGYGTKYAAEQPDGLGSNDEESKSFMEEMREAHERGEERGDEIRSRIDDLPSTIFTSAILAGVLLVVVTFVVVGAEMEVDGIPPEDLMAIAMIASMIVLGFTVLAVIGRVNRVRDANHKWWIWGIGAIIPILGVIPAVVWIWRRNSSAPDDPGQSTTVTAETDI